LTAAGVLMATVYSAFVGVPLLGTVGFVDQLAGVNQEPEAPPVQFAVIGWAGAAPARPSVNTTATHQAR
jgi:hypothetical protein